MHPIRCYSFLVAFSLAVNGYSQVKKVSYDMLVESKVRAIPDSEMQSIWGALIEIYHSNGNYRLIAYGDVIEWQLYLAGEATLYSHTTFREAIFRHTDQTHTDSIRHIGVGETQEVVSGKRCNKVVLQTTRTTITLLVSEEINVDVLQGKKTGQHTELMALLPSLNVFPLKFVIENEAVKITGTHSNTTQIAMPAGLFDISDELPVIPATF